MEIRNGKIIGYDERRRGLNIFVPYDNFDRYMLREYNEVSVGLADGRHITPAQQRKAYALLGEISLWVNGQRTGFQVDEIKENMKRRFLASGMGKMYIDIFSLSNCSVTLARDFISYMIEFVIEYDVPTNEPLYELCEDIEHYVYTMLIHKKCAHCGRVHSDHHHVGAIGMGRNRDKILQIGMLVISLCRDCHILVESRGNSLLDEWHLVPVPMDAKIGKVYGLSNANLGRETK